MAAPVDIAVIPGITAAIARQLRALGIHTSSDLNRTNRSALAAIVPAITLGNIRNWQSFSRLLEIRTISPAAVQSLMAANIDSLDELASKTLTQLRQIIGTPPLSISDDQIVEWLMDAQHLRFSGIVNGTVVAADETPLEGATVRAGHSEDMTDARGRFRFLRLDAASTYSVTISHPVKGTKTFNNIIPSRPSALAGQQFKFPARKASVKPLSALRGDILPAIGSAPIATLAQNEMPEPRDVLRIVDFYVNGDARVVSRFLNYVEGRFIARTYRITKGTLPAGAVIKDDLVMQPGGWTKTRVSSRQIGRLARIAAVQKKYSGRALSNVQFDKLTKQLLAALGDPK